MAEMQGGEMAKKAAAHPFLFTGCWELRQMLGRSARDERQLLEAIEEVPLDSIYYHTHGFSSGTSTSPVPTRKTLPPGGIIWRSCVIG
jgi:hypothetical protein